MNQIEEKLDKVIEVQKQQDRKITEIFHAVAGQPELGVLGIKDTLKSHGERITAIEESKKITWWKALSLGSGAGAAGIVIGNSASKSGLIAKAGAILVGVFGK